MTSDLYLLDGYQEAPSLSSSGIKRLLYESPASFAAYHPKLTQWPDLIEESTKATDRGEIVHRLILGEGANYKVINPADYRNKDGSPAKSFKSAKAKEAKEKAEEEGNIVVSAEEAAKLLAASESVIRMLQDEYGDWPIGESEKVLTWMRETSRGPIHCRAKLDHLSLQHMVVLDPKSTSKGLSKESLRKTAEYDRWYIQQAFYLDGLSRLYPETAGRIRFRFVPFQLDPPYDRCFFDMSEVWMTLANAEIERACELFAYHLSTGEWPGVPRSVSPEPSSYLLQQFQERQIQEEIGE